MTRILSGFLAGSLLSAAGVILADSRAGVMFIAGGIAMLFIQAALIASVSRARVLARFITAVCDSLTQKSTTRHAAPEPQDSQVVADLASALINFGMKRSKAAIVAREAAAAGGTLPQMIQRATAQARAN